jgi:hypothetical protein
VLKLYKFGVNKRWFDGRPSCPVPPNAPFYLLSAVLDMAVNEFRMSSLAVFIDGVCAREPLILMRSDRAHQQI